MNPKRPIRDLERQLRREPDNLALRLTLAAAYRDGDRAVEALALYRSVARAYAEQGRASQAAAVCRSALEIAPEDGELYGLLVHLERASTTRPPPMMGPMTTTSQFPAAMAASMGAGASPGPMSPGGGSPGAMSPGSASHAGASPGAGAHGASSPGAGSQAGGSPGAGPGSAPSSIAPPRLPPLPTLPPSTRPPLATTTPPGREDNPMLATVKRVPPPPPRPMSSLTPLPRVSTTDLETPLPPPLPLHDARDSFVEMPPALSMPDEHDVIPLTVKRTGAPSSPTPAPSAPPPIEDAPSAGLTMPAVSPLSLSSSSVGDERPSSADFAAEMVTRRRPKLTARDLDLLELAGVDALSSDLVPALPVDDPADPAFDPPTDAGPPSDRPRHGGLDEDEPTTPPAPPLPRGRTSDDFADRGTSEFAAAGERSFESTLAQLAPDGGTLEGPLGVFARLPPEAALELARRAVVKSYDPGEIVIREGDLGDACYVIVGGEVAVRKRMPDGEVVELARLGDGSLFGEFALLADRRRHATVAAVTESEIYEIPRLLLRELAAAFPQVGPALEAFYRERLLSNLMMTTPLLHAVASEERPHILSRFHPMHVESGETVVRQGERTGGLYLIVLGAVEVVRDLGDRRATLLAALGEGSYFGEMSLLSGDVASASVVAAGPCELAVLPPHDFYEIVAGNPALWTAMRGEAEVRRLANAQILTGRTGLV